MANRNCEMSKSRLLLVQMTEGRRRKLVEITEKSAGSRFKKVSLCGVRFQCGSGGGWKGRLDPSHRNLY